MSHMSPLLAWAGLPSARAWMRSEKSAQMRVGTANTASATRKLAPAARAHEIRETDAAHSACQDKEGGGYARLPPRKRPE